jgi:hypothetical protein
MAIYEEVLDVLRMEMVASTLMLVVELMSVGFVVLVLQDLLLLAQMLMRHY